MRQAIASTQLFIWRKKNLEYVPPNALCYSDTVDDKLQKPKLASVSEKQNLLNSVK